MSIWSLLVIVAVLGAAGGVANALMSDNGFILPRRETTGGTNILRPGFVGNMLLGALAAVIFWGLYGPFAEVNVVGVDPRQQPQVAGATRGQGDMFGETLAGLVTALLLGVAGARVITNEVDKKLLRATAAQAATNDASPEAAAAISSASPARALEIASGQPPDRP